MTGKMIMEVVRAKQGAGIHTVPIDVSGLGKGVYQINISMASLVKTIRLLKL
jgi:hypothetical protein